MTSSLSGKTTQVSHTRFSRNNFLCLQARTQVPLRKRYPILFFLVVSRNIRRRRSPRDYKPWMSTVRHPNRNRIMVPKNIGGDVALLVRDVNHVELTGKIRNRTWVRTGHTWAHRRSRNTMGYQTVIKAEALKPHPLR